MVKRKQRQLTLIRDRTPAIGRDRDISPCEIDVSQIANTPA
jgi:hypothetical protein